MSLEIWEAKGKYRNKDIQNDVFIHVIADSFESAARKVKETTVQMGFDPNIVRLHKIAPTTVRLEIVKPFFDCSFKSEEIS